MFMRTVRRNEATAANRRLYFDPVDATDGFTPELGEAGGQPQISTDGVTWTNTNVGTLTHTGIGRYYADVTQAGLLINSGLIMGRYKSAATRETRSLNALDVGGDLQDAIARLTNTTELDISTGDLSVKEADWTTERFELTDEDSAGDVHKIQRA